MPQLQTVDLSPTPYQGRETPLEKAAERFSDRFRSNQIQKQDSDELSKIYKQYQQDGQNIGNALMNLQTNPNLSPTRRVEAADQLLKFQQHNNALQKQAQKQQTDQARLNQKQESDQAREKTRQANIEYQQARLKQQEASLQQKNDKIINKQSVDDAQAEKGRRALERNNASQADIDLYEAAPIGGKTKIVENLIDKQNRGQQPAGLDNPDIEDYDLGLTPKERVKRQDERFRVQTPLVNANSQALSSLQNEDLSIGLLDELTDSGKVGSGLHALNINPQTGALIIPQFGTAEEQLFVKTINDFTVKAKDSFGANVTNFELDRFMQRLPTLANSPEGRKLILRQMGIINHLNQLDKSGIQEVFDKYGVRNIDYADAEKIARTKIKDQKEALRKEYIELEKVASKDEIEEIRNIKSRVKPGYVAMRKPDGTVKQFPEKNVTNLEEKGYKKL